MSDQSHDARVRVRRNAKTYRFRVWCPTCGQVGVSQAYEADAQAIADRHREVGGFEHQATLGQRLGFETINSRTHGYNGQEHR